MLNPYHPIHPQVAKKVETLSPKPVNSWLGAVFLGMSILFGATSCSSEVSSVSQSQVESTVKTESLTDKWQPLLDKDLSQWEIWLGVPHSSTVGLPEGTYVADNLNIHGDPALALGLGQGNKQVFQMTEENGQPVLHISGEIYGALSSLKQYANYHLSLEVKWGEKKWAPRLDKKRDSGLLFHCYGEHGAFWRVWKKCQELQIQESDFGDYIPLAGPKGNIRSNGDEPLTWSSSATEKYPVTGYSHAGLEPDYEHGKWNLVELYTFADKAVFQVNGEVVMVVEDSANHQDLPLSSGQLQLQSEGAEIFYRDVKIRGISKMPAGFKQYWDKS